jgi:hypothetical protein
MKNRVICLSDNLMSKQADENFERNFAAFVGQFREIRTSLIRKQRMELLFADAGKNEPIRHLDA